LPVSPSPEPRRRSDLLMSTYQLTLYIVGGTEIGRRAVANLEAIVRDQLSGDAQIEVLDVVRSPIEAKADRVIATPLLIRRQPEPVLKVVGDLSDASKVLRGLGLTVSVPLAEPQPPESRGQR